MAFEDFAREHQVPGASNRSFGNTFAGVFALVALWPVIFGDGAVRSWAAVLAAGFALVAWWHPALLAPWNRAWLRLGLALGRFVSPIAMGIVFYLTVLPVGLLLKVLRKDPLRLRLQRDAASYWIERKPPGPDPKAMDQQF